MAVIETWLRQDLKGLVTVRSLQGQVFSLDNGGNLIGVKVTKDGQPVTLTGTVTGYCILSDGQTVTVTGSGKSGIQNGNEAYIVLPQLVYSVPGQISIVIKLTSGSVTTTLAACTGYVYRSRTSNEVVPPGTPIPDLATMEEVIRRATEATTRATEAATDAEKVDASMTKEGDVITISVTDRDGNVTEKTVTDQSEAMRHKADIDGYYEELAAGTADQLVSTEAVTDTAPYLYRKSGGSVDIGNRETLEKIVGGTVAWNQLVESTKKQGTIAPNGSQTHSTAFCNVNTALNHVYFLSAKVTYNGSKLPMRVYAQVGNGNYGRPKQDITSVGTSAHEWLAKKESESQFSATIGISNVATSDKLTSDDAWAYDDLIIIDLTAMFGPTIADYIYNLEQTTAGAGVAWFRKLFPKDYYPYNAGELISVKPSSHDMVGFNQWNEEWEVGGFAAADGTEYAWTDRIRCKHYIPVISGETYFTTKEIYVFFYDSDKAFISFTQKMANTTFNIPARCQYIRFSTTSNSGTTYNHDICINLSHSGSRNGEYEPYEKHSYPLADVELRGPIAIDADGKLVYSGDEYTPDGQVKRKYGTVDLGSLTNWVKNTSWFQSASAAQGSVITTNGDTRVYTNLDCKINTFNGSTSTSSVFLGISEVGSIRVSFGGVYDNMTVEQFKNAMANKYLLYELATPETEEVAPYTPVQVVDDWGTEEFVDTREVAIPVGHSTSYMANLRDKLQHLPSLAEEDGEYIVRQSRSQMSLVSIGDTEEITGLKSALDDLSDGLIVESEAEITNITVHEGKRYGTEGNLIDVTPSIGTAEAVEIPVTAGQKIHWVCYYANQNSTYNVKYLMSDNSIVPDTNYTKSGTNTYTFVVPQSCIKLLVSCWVLSSIGNTFYLVETVITPAKEYVDGEIAELDASVNTNIDALETTCGNLYMPKTVGIVAEYPALFNSKNIITGYWYNTSTGAVEKNKDRFIQPLVECKPSTVYTKRTCNVCIYDESKAFIGKVLWNESSTFTTPNNAKYLGVSMTTSSLSYVRLVEANIPTGDVIQPVSKISPNQIKTVVVAADGSGDYTSLLDALLSVARKRAVIEVRAGNYNLISEYKAHYGDDFFDSGSFNNEGLVIDNGTIIEMDSMAIVAFNYTGSNTLVTQYFSPFKFSGSGGTLRGGQIVCSNCRYAIHDDTYSSAHDKRIIDGVYIYYRSDRNVAIGGGLGYSSDVELKNCYVDSGTVGYGVFYHNASYEGAQSMVKIHDNYFTAGIYIQPYGPSVLISKALVSNNKTPTVARITSSMTVDNFELVEWNNETN